MHRIFCAQQSCKKKDKPYSLSTFMEHAALHCTNITHTTDHYAFKCDNCPIYFVTRIHAEKHAYQFGHTVSPSIQRISGRSNGCVRFNEILKNMTTGQMLNDQHDQGITARNRKRRHEENEMRNSGNPGSSRDPFHYSNLRANDELLLNRRPMENTIPDLNYVPTLHANQRQDLHFDAGHRQISSSGQGIFGPPGHVRPREENDRFSRNTTYAQNSAVEENQDEPYIPSSPVQWAQDPSYEPSSPTFSPRPYRPVSPRFSPQPPNSGSSLQQTPIGHNLVRGLSQPTILQSYNNWNYGARLVTEERSTPAAPSPKYNFSIGKQGPIGPPPNPPHRNGNAARPPIPGFGCPRTPRRTSTLGGHNLVRGLSQPTFLLPHNGGLCFPKNTSNSYDNNRSLWHSNNNQEQTQKMERGFNGQGNMNPRNRSYDNASPEKSPGNPDVRNK